MKEAIIQLLFAFFKSYMSPKDAVMATLGGWGLEAGIWKEYGIAKDNGWLIERSLSRRKGLIQNFPFHYVNQLASFPRLFQSVKGDGAGVDFFHLDLCGTLEGSYELIQKVLPLVLASQGKCLAVTVADQRRNISHENFSPVFRDGKKLFGKSSAEELLRQLKAESEELVKHLDGEVHADGIARREYGFLVHLAKVLGNTEINRMERYVYYSEVGSRKTAFRMRTYMFHLGTGILDVKKWIKAPIQLVMQEGSISIDITSTTEEKGATMKFNENAYPALTGMLMHASAAVKADFDRLMQDLASSEVFVSDLVGVLEKHGLVGRTKRTTQASVDDAPLTSFPGERFGTTDKKVALKIFLLQAEAGGQDEFEKASPVAARYMGIIRQKNKTRTLGSHLARTKGDKFRPLFVRTVLETTPKEQHDSVLEAIASYYTALGEVKDAKKLLHEATEAGYSAT